MASHGTDTVLMDENTTIRKYVCDYVKEHPDPCAQLEACYRGNVGLIFTNSNLGEVQVIVKSNVPPGHQVHCTQGLHRLQPDASRAYRSRPRLPTGRSR